MKHITIDNIDYIIARRQPGRDVELVEVATGRIRWCSPNAVGPGQDHEKFIVPDMVPLAFRDPQFLMELREKRRKLLEPKAKKARAPKPRDPNKPPARRRGTNSKLNETIAAVVPQHLQATIAALMAARKKK